MARQRTSLASDECRCGGMTYSIQIRSFSLGRRYSLSSPTRRTGRRCESCPSANEQGPRSSRHDPPPATVPKKLVEAIHLSRLRRVVPNRSLPGPHKSKVDASISVRASCACPRVEWDSRQLASDFSVSVSPPSWASPLKGRSGPRRTSRSWSLFRRCCRRRRSFASTGLFKVRYAGCAHGRLSCRKTPPPGSHISTSYLFSSRHRSVLVQPVRGPDQRRRGCCRPPERLLSC